MIKTVIVRSVSILCVAVLWSISLSVSAVTIDFDDLNDLDSVTTQYDGVTFLNAAALTSGVSLNEYEFPPLSGANVIFDALGPILIDFDTAVTDLSASFTYLTSITLIAYDIDLNIVEIVRSAFSSNLALSGDQGSTPNELIAIAYEGVSHLVIQGDFLGGSFTMDELTFNPIAQQVDAPEPLSLLAVGILLLFSMRRIERIQRGKQ